MEINSGHSKKSRQIKGFIAPRNSYATKGETMLFGQGLRKFGLL
jgi:hypothetical protein